MRWQFAALRTKTSVEGWLVAERLLPGGDGENETKYYFCNLPAQATLKEVERLIYLYGIYRARSTLLFQSFVEIYHCSRGREKFN